MPTVCCASCGVIEEDTILMYGPPQRLILFVHWTCYERTVSVPCAFCEERMSRFMAGVPCRTGYYCEHCRQYFFRNLRNRAYSFLVS